MATTLRLDVGPLPAEGGLEWIAQARFLVAVLRTGTTPMPFAVPPEVLDEFERYFGDWEEAAAVEPFVWSCEVEVTVLRHLMTYWFNLSQVLADHPEYQPAGSPEAQQFYRNLIAAILAQLSAAQPDLAVLEERWPAV